MKYIACIVLLVLVSFKSYALDVRPCQNCVDLTSFLYEAKTIHLAKFGESYKALATYQLVNYQTGEVRAVQSYSSYNAEIGTLRYSGTFVTPDAALVEEVRELIILSKSIPKDFYSESGTYFPDDVFDGLGSKRVQNIISSHLATDMAFENIMTRIGGYTSLPVSLAGKILGANIVTKFVFSDGSSMIFRVSGIDENGLLEFEYVKGTAYDSEGNQVPEKKEDATQVYRFDTSTSIGIRNLNLFLNHLSAIGVSVVYSKENVPSGSVTIIDCPSGECEVKKQGGDDGDI